MPIKFPRKFGSLLGLNQAFIPLLRNGSSKGCGMYNNYLSCEVCGAELTRASQKQKLDGNGYMHSFCQKCHSEKYPK
jgi:hypothetical protein